jgi:ferredoxin-nitrate reductase
VSEIIKTLCPYCGVGCGLEVVATQKGASGSDDQLRLEKLGGTKADTAMPGASSNLATSAQHWSHYPQNQKSPIQNWKVRGDRTHPSSQGMVCLKGATVAESLDKDRLLYPMVRNSLNEAFQRVSWDEALNLIAQRIETVCATSGSDSLCMYGSGQMQSEDYYVAQKLFKGCLGTNNFDSNSRLCMSSAVKAYVQSLGADGPPCCYEDLEITDCAFIIGSNAAECHPIIFNRLQKHHKKNPSVKLIVVDPRYTPTAEVADLHLAIRPGTDIDLLNGIAHLLLRWGEIDAEFIEDCTNHFSEFVQVVQHYPPSIVAARCEISVKDLELAARYWAEGKNVLSLWSMGVNQSQEGTAKASSIINLHLLTGQIGKPGAGPFSLTGQPNAMGGREVGGLSNLLPGYRFVDNPQHRAEVEKFWGLRAGKIAPENGRTAWEIITGLESGDVEFLWIVATNPAVSLPDLERVKAALKRSPFTICQDAYYPTETAAYAHVLLPAAQWGEKTGTMTNSERVVTLQKAFRQPPQEAKVDWEIFAEVGRRLGFADKFEFSSASSVHAEFVQLTRDRPCDMTGINHARLEKSPLQWPICQESEELGVMSYELESLASNSQLPTPNSSLPTPNSSLLTPNSQLPTPNSKRLYTNNRYYTPDGRARFIPSHSRGLAEPPDSNYPFVLTTGRVYGHWHTQTRTGRIEKIRQMYPEPFIEIHPRDADDLGIANNSWVEVRSARGNSRFCAKVTRAIPPGTVFVPIHWGTLWAMDSEANSLTHSQSCPDSQQPELKACAVQLLPVSLELRINKYQVRPQNGKLLDIEKG